MKRILSRRAFLRGSVGAAAGSYIASKTILPVLVADYDERTGVYRFICLRGERAAQERGNTQDVKVVNRNKPTVNLLGTRLSHDDICVESSSRGE